MEINFIKNPVIGGIPAREKKLEKIKNDESVEVMELYNCLRELRGETIKENMIEEEIIVYTKK